MFQEEEKPKVFSKQYITNAYGEAGFAVMAAALFRVPIGIEINYQEPPELPINAMLPACASNVTLDQDHALYMAKVAAVALHKNKNADWMEVYSKSLAFHAKVDFDFLENDWIRDCASKGLRRIRKHWSAVEEIAKAVLTYQGIARQTVYQVTPEMLGLRARKKKTRK